MRRVACLSIVFFLAGCAAVQTAVSHRDLDVQNKMTTSIFLDPVTTDKKVVYVQVRNTSDRPAFDLATELAKAVAGKGYRIATDLKDAHYLLQVNVLQVGKISPSAAQQAFLGGYGSALGGAAAGSAIGSTTGSYDSTVAGGLIGGAVSLIADAAVKNVTYSVITDVRVSERSNTAVSQQMTQSLTQGSGGTVDVSSDETTHWKRYQTRVLSTANQVNLELKAALPSLKSGTVRSIAGIF